MRNKKPLYLCLKMLFISVQTGLVYEEKMMRKKILYPLLIIAEIIAAFLYYSYQKCKYSEIAREFFTQSKPRKPPVSNVGRNWHIPNIKKIIRIFLQLEHMFLIVINCMKNI